MLNKLFINNTLDRSQYPIFYNKRRVKVNERDLHIFLNSHYDFKKQIWKSGIFEIDQKDWETSSDTTVYKFPILGKLHKYLNAIS